MTALEQLIDHVDTGETLVFTLSYSPDDTKPWLAQSGPHGARLAGRGMTPAEALEHLAHYILEDQ